MDETDDDIVEDAVIEAALTVVETAAIALLEAIVANVVPSPE